MSDTQQETTRGNDQGDPCPAWCVKNHARMIEVLGTLVPLRQHGSGRKTLYAADYSRSAELQLLQFSGTGAARLRAGAYTADGHGEEITVTTAEAALALALLVEAAGAMDDAGRAALAAGLREASASLRAEGPLS